MKILRAIFAAAAVFAVFAFVFACTGGENRENDADGIFVVNKEGKSDYVIVRSDTADKREIEAAVKLRNRIMERTGVSLSIETDWIGRNDQMASNDMAPEIVVGVTNRPVPSVGSEGEYVIAVEGRRIVISATPSGIAEAVEAFIREFVTSEGVFVPAATNMRNNTEITEIKEIKEIPEMSQIPDPGYGGKPVSAKIVVDEESLIPQLYIDGTYYAPTVFFGNTDIGTNVAEQAALAAAAGIHLHSIIYNLNYDTDYTEESSFGTLRARMDSVLRGDPYAKIILRVNTGAYYNPDTVEEDDWRVRDRIEYVDGSYAAMASTASERWAKEAAARLVAIVEYMRTSEDYADHLICIHLEKGEWFEQDFRERGSDVSATNSASFGRWLAEKYKTDLAFGEAWGVDYAISEAAVPRDLPNNVSSDHSYPNTLLSTKAEQKYVDYIDYIGELVSGRIDDFAKAIKEVSDGNLIVIAFYGYLFELSDAQSGHYDMKRLLDSEYLDGFAAPISYADRTGPNGSVGATSAYMTAIDSVVRHGKLWFQESDQRTFVNSSPDDPYLPKLKTLEDIYQVHRREVGMGMVHGNAVWAMDLGATGWLLDIGIWENLASLSEKYTEYIHDQKKPPRYDAVFVIDEKAESVAGMPSFNVSYNLLGGTRTQAYHAGVSVAFATMDDVLAGLFGDAKIYFFMNPYRISDADAKRLESVVQREGVSAVYMYGFGETSAEALLSLTGMTYEKTAKAAQTSMKIGEGGKKIGLAAPKVTNSVNPRFSVSGGGEVFAEWSGAGGGCAAAVHAGDGWKAYFYGGTFLAAADIRALCSDAGVHVISEDGDVVIANDSLVVFCASSGGTKTLRFGREVDIYDCFADKKYTAVREIQAEFFFGETRWYFID